MQGEMHILGHSEGATIAFLSRDGEIWPYRLFGHLCGADGYQAGDPRVRGPAVVRADDTRVEGDAFSLVQSDFSDNTAQLAWSAMDESLRLESNWKICNQTGVVSRRDRLTNQGKEAVTIRRCLSRITLPPGSYEFYAQDNRWCREADGQWIQKHTGTLTLGSKPGRFSDEGTPYFCVREIGADSGLAFHILPRANWTAHMHAISMMNGRPYTVLELGLSDRDLFHRLEPGETLSMPEILIQDLPGGVPENAAPALHVFAEFQVEPTFPEPPVMYNTWFDLFPILDPERSRDQLAAAADIGCEVYVIDDGWYGTGVTDTKQKIGDWQERDVSAFRGKLKEFGDEVRAAGLGFGLWVEP